MRTLRTLLILLLALLAQGCFTVNVPDIPRVHVHGRTDPGRAEGEVRTGSDDEAEPQEAEPEAQEVEKDDDEDDD